MAEDAGRKKPWIVDSSTVDISSLPDMPYSREALRDFFAGQLGDLERILVAPKGYGKTLYLKYKSHLIRKKYRNSILIFPNIKQDIEFLKLSLDWREMITDVSRLSVDNWSLLWEFVLTAKGLQMADGHEALDDPYLVALLRDPNEPVGDLLSSVIRDTDNFGTTTSTRLKNVRRAFNEAGKDVAIFVDNADEMFVGLDQAQLHRKKEAKGKAQPAAPARWAFDMAKGDIASSSEVAQTNPTMWRAAQVGLMLAVREIERATGQLSVYTTLRAEAVYSAEHRDVLQAQTYTIPIKYTQEDLEEIFAWHVNMMPADRLVAPDASHPAHKLLGEQPIEHKYVHHDGASAQEEPFDLLLRHTMRSPRDIVVIGGALARLSKSERMGPHRSDHIHYAIQEGVSTLFKYLRENVIPRWEPSLDAALKEINSSVIERRKLSKLAKEARTLYSYGMLGVAERNGGPGRYKQRFLTQWDTAYAVEDVQLPSADFYIAHPWLVDAMKRNGAPNFRPDVSAVIGNGCPFYEPGLPRISIEGNSGRPTLWTDGAIDEPVSEKGAVPMIAVFLFATLTACHTHRSTKVTKAQVHQARDELRKRFPNCQWDDILNPFDNADHSSHLRRYISDVFPALGTRVRDDFIVVGYFTPNPEKLVSVKFLDLDRLRVDLKASQVSG